MGRPWDLRRPAETAHQLPSPLRMNRAMAGGGHPGRHLGAGPAAAIGGGRLQCLSQLRLLGWRQQPRGPGISRASVAEACRARLVVALGERAHPVGRVAGDSGHPLGGPSVGEPPDPLPVATRHRGVGGALTALQFVKREMWRNGEAFWHVPIIYPDLV
jgi:hypothetical protein